MSFRNSNSNHNDKNQLEDNSQANHLLITSKICINEGNANEQIIKKISNIIVHLHEGYLIRCKNIQIYRDLSEEEQNLLLKVQKNTSIHTALAGILAIDSCVKCLQKQENFIINNMIRCVTNIVGSFKSLEKELSKSSTNSTDFCLKLRDNLKYLLQQMYYLPVARGREEDQERQLTLLEKQTIDSNEQLQYHLQQQQLLSELQRENEMLKVGLKEKQGYISMLQARYERGLPRFQKIQEKKTSHSLAFRTSTQKSSQNESNSASVQHLYEEIAHLKQELLEKNNIVIKMNEQFATEMEKYNSVFKRLQEQNRALKRYSDVDTAYLLDELQYEIDILREEKRKDQMIISDIQRKIEGISMARSSRATTRNGYEFINHQPYSNDYNIERTPQFEPRTYQNRYSKFYSPNYAPTARLSPHSRVPNLNLRESMMLGIPHQQTYRTSHGRSSRLREEGNFIRKSRSKLTQNRQGKDMMEPKSSPNINLFERVMAKRT